MKKINLRGISESLNEEELKSVKGGRDDGTGDCYTMPSCDGSGDCNGRICGEACIQSSSGRIGTCIIWAFAWTTCKTCAFGVKQPRSGVENLPVAEEEY
jgi:natural product precursor